MLARATLLAALAALLLAAPRPAAAQAASAPVDLRVNSLRVWLNTMEQVGAAVNTYTSKDGQPPTQTNFAVNRVLRCGRDGRRVEAASLDACVAGKRGRSATPA